MTSPGVGDPAPGNPDQQIDDAQDDHGGSSWGLWAAVGSLTTAAFAAGFLVGVISDGNAEIMREFREKSPNHAPISAAASTTAEIGPKAAPSESPAASPERRQNNQVDWAITIAPRTNVSPVEVRTADLDADSKVEFGMVYGSQVSPVATLWVQAGSSAKIVLPIGRYSVRTTRVAFKAGDVTMQTEPTVLDGAMEVLRESKDVTQASLAANRSGIWRIAGASVKAGEKPTRSRAKQRSRSKDFEYEGLGEGSRTGGTSTYDG